MSVFYTMNRRRFVVIISGLVMVAAIIEQNFYWGLFGLWAQQLGLDIKE